MHSCGRRDGLALQHLCVSLWAAGLFACAPAPQTGDRAFVTEAATASIAVIDLDSGALRRRIDVGLLPHDVALSPDGRTLYAALAGSQAVAVIDTDTESLRATWTTAPAPARRADGSAIGEHASERGAPSRSCHSCHRDGGAKPRYVGARPVALALSADGARLYVGHLNTGELLVLDTSTGDRVAATAAVAGPVHELAGLARLDDVLYLTYRATPPSHAPGFVRRLEASTLAPLGDVPSSSNPVEVQAVPSLGLALVAHFDSDQLSLLRDGAEVASLTVANGPLGVLPLPGDRALVLGYYAQALSVVDLAGGQSETWPLTFGGRRLSNPTHAALGSDGRIAWVVQSGSDAHLLGVDVEAKRVVRTMPINGLSFAVAVVPSRTWPGWSTSQP